LAQAHRTLSVLVPLFSKSLKGEMERVDLNPAEKAARLAREMCDYTSQTSLQVQRVFTDTEEAMNSANASLKFLNEALVDASVKVRRALKLTEELHSAAKVAHTAAEATGSSLLGNAADSMLSLATCARDLANNDDSETSIEDCYQHLQNSCKIDPLITLMRNLGGTIQWHTDEVNIYKAQQKKSFVAPPSVPSSAASSVPPSATSAVPSSAASSVPPSATSAVPPSSASAVPPSASAVPSSAASAVPPLPACLWCNRTVDLTLWKDLLVCQNKDECWKQTRLNQTCFHCKHGENLKPSKTRNTMVCRDKSACSARWRELRKLWED